MRGIIAAVSASVLLLALSFDVATSDAGIPDLESFRLRPFSANEFYSFVEVFSEMRGPLRVQILKDRKTDFADADPLKYVMKIKGEKDVKRMLGKHGLSWDGFTELMGNVLIAYMSVQPDKTKAAIMKQIADYGLEMSNDQIPPEYRDVVREFIRTDAGASMAVMALGFIVQIPEQNVEIVKGKKLTLDKMFYTRFWKDKI